MDIGIPGSTGSQVGKKEEGCRDPGWPTKKMSRSWMAGEEDVEILDAEEWDGNLRKLGKEENEID